MELLQILLVKIAHDLVLEVARRVVEFVARKHRDKPGVEKADIAEQEFLKRLKEMGMDGNLDKLGLANGGIKEILHDAYLQGRMMDMDNT